MAVRRSETAEQQEYEQLLIREHYSEGQVEHEKKHLMDEAHVSASRRRDNFSLKDKARSFWKNTVAPAFPEAIGDISLMRKSLHVEATTVKELTDSRKHPEIDQVAHVRRGLDLCAEELQYLARRKTLVRDCFCKYLGLDPAEVHVDDVPIVAFGGSGGGYRAMIAMLAYAEEMKHTGLWNLLTYVAGVSGSCWALASYYTWSGASMRRAIDHCKNRLSPYHPLSPEAVREVLGAPQGPERTLGPLVQKHKSGLKTVAMDLYSVFTTGHLFLHNQPSTEEKSPGMFTDVAGPEIDWHKWTNVSRHLREGKEPLPILTAIRHERPWKDWVDEEHPFKEGNVDDQESQEDDAAWFQWFEITPYEVGCDELRAWVATWAFGRPFEHGKSTMQLPEQSLALLLGLCVSAPAGPLTSYIATIRRSLPAGFLGNSIQDVCRGMAGRLWGQQGKEEFESRHPLHACNEHNYMFSLTQPGDRDKDALPIENSPRIHLIDAGMDNNCPTYVLLHPERRVDVILSMDASSDVLKDNAAQRIDQMASRRTMRFAKRYPEVKAGTDPKDPERFAGLYGQIFDGKLLSERPKTVIDSYEHTVKNPPAPPCYQECTMVYLPLLPNQSAAPDFDPSTAKFSGSYNMIWAAEQVQLLVDVSAANFRAAEDNIKSALRDAWLRKRALRVDLVAEGQV